MFSSIFKDLLGCFEIKSKTMQVTQLCVAKLRDMAYGYEKGKQCIPFLAPHWNYPMGLGGTCVLVLKKIIKPINKKIHNCS